MNFGITGGGIGLAGGFVLFGAGMIIFVIVAALVVRAVRGPDDEAGDGGAERERRATEDDFIL